MSKGRSTTVEVRAHPTEERGAPPDEGVREKRALDRRRWSARVRAVMDWEWAGGLQMRLPIPRKKNAIASRALSVPALSLPFGTGEHGATYPISDWSSAMDEKNGPNSATSEISNDQSAPPYTLAARRSSAYMLP